MSIEKYDYGDSEWKEDKGKTRETVSEIDVKWIFQKTAQSFYNTFGDGENDLKAEGNAEISSDMGEIVSLV